MTGSPALSLQHLADLPSAVRKPTYDIDAIRPGIVHLGLGAFHRAHEAIYTDDLLDAGGDPAWGIAAVSMRRPDVADALAQQQGLYTVTEYDPDRGVSVRVIAAIRETLVLATAAQEVAGAIARPGTRVVSLTVTEKAYYRRGGGAALDLTAQPVRDDLEAAWPSRTAIGALAAGLELRRGEGGGPLTVVCCDNLPHNGAVLRQLCRDFAEAWRPGLAAWIDANVTFPSSMVDRITPATTPELIAETARALGCEDRVPIACESFRQWVVEDDFAAGRPPWDLGGAQFVADVRPFEEMKLRMLNASHSALAYLGLLAGCEHVHDALALPELHAFVDATMAGELAPTVEGVPAADLDAYRHALLRRFGSPRPAHRLAQIAEDGSQKIPIRVLNPLRERLTEGAASDGLVLIVAAWLTYHERVAAGDLPGPLKDPLADRLLEAARMPRSRDRVRALEDVFGAALAQDASFLDRLDIWHARLAAAAPADVVARAVRSG
ncbi:MAG: mannitol dehydrogenase family protein [Xanthomonadales bacterium]|nr:mannitol dehydrogenase family protein [Xanthomonadales bacterium]